MSALATYANSKGFLQVAVIVEDEKFFKVLLSLSPSPLSLSLPLPLSLTPSPSLVWFD